MELKVREISAILESNLTYDFITTGNARLTDIQYEPASCRPPGKSGRP